MKKAKLKSLDNRKNILSTLDITLKPKEAYLAISDTKPYYYDYLVFKDSTNALFYIDEPNIHVGTFQDSVLCGDSWIHENCSDYDVFDIRYFPYQFNRIEFYDHLYKQRGEDEKFTIYIKNTGLQSMEVKMLWGAVFKVAPEEELRITYGMTEGGIDKSFRDSKDLYDVFVR